MTRLVVVVLLLVACHHELKIDQQVEVAQAYELDAGVALDVRTDQRAQLEARELLTTGPVEEQGRWFGPDGGVAFEGTRRTGGSTLEAWQTQSKDTDEHVHVDAQVNIKAASTGKANLHKEEESDAGGFWLGIKLGALALVVLAILAVVAYRKLRKEIPIP